MLDLLKDINMCKLYTSYTVTFFSSAMSMLQQCGQKSSSSFFFLGGGLLQRSCIRTADCIVSSLSCLQRLRSSSCLLPPDLCGRYLWKSPTATQWMLPLQLWASREADLVSTTLPLTMMLRTRQCSSQTCGTG